MRIFRIILLVLLYTMVAMVLTTAIQVAVLRVHNPRSTAWMRMRARQAKAESKELTIRQTWSPLSEISPAMRQAVVAAEDDRFFEHQGFDWEAIQKARAKNEKTGKIRRGGSTITQQLAKNLYLSPSRSYWRKGREAIITLFMEWLLPKDRILELYLNLIEFGPGIFGVEEAAKHHFRTSARQLSVDQASRLAAIIPSPLRWRVNGPYVSRRAGRIARIIRGGPVERERIALEPVEPELPRLQPTELDPPEPTVPEPEEPVTPVPQPRDTPRTGDTVQPSAVRPAQKG